MRKLILILIAMVAIVANVNAQVMTVVLNNGTQVEYATNEIDHIEFSEDNGTSSSYSIVGTWEETHWEGSSYTRTETITFSKDGTWTTIISWSDTSRTSSHNGTYTYSNGTLTSIRTDGGERPAETYKINFVSATKFKLTTSDGEQFTFNKVN